jgi:hypothetical protein
VPDQQQPAAPDQPDTPTIFGKFDGLVNVLDRERLGSRDLIVAYDIDLDDDGQAHRRRGRTQVMTGNIHSLFNANDGTLYGVLNQQLGIINPNYTFVGLGAYVGGGYSDGLKNVAFLQIDKSIYFSNLTTNGIINHPARTVGPWGPAQPFWYSPVIAPTSTLPAVAGKWLNGPPKASILTYYNGRIYMAAGRVVWCTEHLLFNYVDLVKNYIQFEGEVTMLAAIADGLYVGTDEGTYFLGGARFEELKRMRVIDSGVIPGSAVIIPSELANPPQVGVGVDTPMEVSVAFMTTRGFCVGEDSGKATNLTESKMFFPVSQRSQAFWRRQDGMNTYVVCADSEGDPLNGARIGDFIDAEIVRGNVSWVDTYDSANAVEQTS